jgi:hypothetical protein
LLHGPDGICRATRHPCILGDRCASHLEPIVVKFIGYIAARGPFDPRTFLHTMNEHFITKSRQKTVSSCTGGRSTLEQYREGNEELHRNEAHSVARSGL